MAERVKAIVQIMDQIAQCRQDELAGKCKNNPLAGPFLGQMDWLEELWYAVHGQGTYATLFN
jgi:hypothetical protein